MLPINREQGERVVPRALLLLKDPRIVPADFTPVYAHP